MLSLSILSLSSDIPLHVQGTNISNDIINSPGIKYVVIYLLEVFHSDQHTSLIKNRN